MQIGLRIDVDTLRGTREGVPALCRSLAGHSARATFFFSVGPDNMGRHLWRLVRPRFLLKMLRSRAAGLYGWDILLRGVFAPGPLIGAYAGHCLRLAADGGHEMGFHAWDHHAWQMGVERMTLEAIRAVMSRGLERMAELVGSPPICAAAPGWRSTATALLAQDSFAFQFASDCRGTSVFYPVVAGRTLKTVQVPVTLPTYDEIIGRNGIDDSNYNAHLLGLLSARRLNVLTIHAEVEGIARRALFEDFLRQAAACGIKFVSLGSLVPERKSLPATGVGHGVIPGREGWVALQQ